MKLSNLSVTPQLVNVQIDDEDIVEQYGEPIEFWIYDRQPMQTFMKLATVEEKGIGELAEVVTGLILDENGKPMLNENEIPPATVMMRVISKVVEHLGNLERLTTVK
jgi:hypothetical protein